MALRRGERIHCFLGFALDSGTGIDAPCPHCVDSFAFDWQRIKSHTLHSRVRVRCPGCQNVVEVVTNAYSVIHGADPEKYQWGQILEVLPPDFTTSEEAIRRNIQLHYEIYQKRSNWRPG